MCLSSAPVYKTMCEEYIRGVVEMLWLVRSVSREQKLEVLPVLTICKEAIDQEWALIIQVVRSNIKKMQTGLAAFGISEVLNDHFCKFRPFPN